MKLSAPFDSLKIDLDDEERKLIQDCFKKQIDFDSQGKSASLKLNQTKICGAQWKHLWKEGIVTNGDTNIKTLTVPLNVVEQLVLLRYIEAEKMEKDFITRGLSKQFVHEIFLHCYFACHGCQDHTQKVLLNEKDIDKIFWEPETNVKKLLGTTGSNVKALCIYDCCREPYQPLRDRIIEALKKIGVKQSNSQIQG